MAKAAATLALDAVVDAGRGGGMNVDATIQQTPLADRHAQLGARLIEFGGWLMPVQYRGILEEHRAVRERAGLFDLSHMGELFVEGPRPARRSPTRSSLIRPRSRMDAPSTR